MQMQALIDLAVSSFVTFFIVIDPVGLIAIFNGLARGLTAPNAVASPIAAR